MPTADEIAAAAAALERRGAREILEWALARYAGRVALSVSFGGGGLVLAHMLSEIDRSVPLLFLDTRFHFEETLAFKREFAARYGLTVVELAPEGDRDPGPLYATDPDRCCLLRKVQPMHRALAAMDAWVSAIRRDQSPTRAAVRVAEPYALDGRTLCKVHPIAHWSAADVRRYLERHRVPHHPLLDRGYTSIGCWPCTRPTLPGEHERAGRWSGTGKTECGLHIAPSVTPDRER
ncbi:MAG TPA: phosphoadenylyl-sulfate reductase [Gemmatimonadaceae bacterium]|nr:phosphoadenylyl-sulfate reductase [Gemmatimonadaceae bacterium]